MIVLLKVKTPAEVETIIRSLYEGRRTEAEIVSLGDSLSRVLSYDVISEEFVPGFNRSTVDGFAVIASDTFGCSDSMPAVLSLAGEILMGDPADKDIVSGNCITVATGADLPKSADAVVMVEHTEDYGDNMIGILRPCAPGNNIIFKGDDVSAQDLVFKAGTVLTPHYIGVLAALGICEVSVMKRPVVGIISTGDELVDPSRTPKRGQVRDVNTAMLLAAMRQYGAGAVNFGIVEDDREHLSELMLKAVRECDVVLISGGSSAGVRDMTASVIESSGELLLHGIAMKPGKPTILGVINDKTIYGLPGHPVAAYFVTELFVRPLIMGLMGAKVLKKKSKEIISEAISSNHGRAEYIAVTLEQDGFAHPIRGKSGLITSLTGADGYICIPRDSEGIAAKSPVVVTYWG